jgi:CBS domain-containing protein
MSCRAAMTEKFTTVSPGDAVESVLKDMKKSKIDFMPVVDEAGKLAGLFSLQILMKNLLPVSVPVTGGFGPDVKLPAAPGIAKRLNKLHTLVVSDLMDRKVNTISPEIPIWEAVNLLVQQGSPLLVVEQSGKAVGMITAQSALDELNRLKDFES